MGMTVHLRIQVCAAVKLEFDLARFETMAHYLQLLQDAIW